MKFLSNSNKVFCVFHAIKREECHNGQARTLRCILPVTRQHISKHCTVSLQWFITAGIDFMITDLKNTNPIFRFAR